MKDIQFEKIEINGGKGMSVGRYDEAGRRHGVWLSYETGNFVTKPKITTDFVAGVETGIKLIISPNSIDPTEVLLVVAEINDARQLGFGFERKGNGEETWVRYHEDGSTSIPDLREIQSQRERFKKEIKRHNQALDELCSWLIMSTV